MRAMVLLPFILLVLWPQGSAEAQGWEVEAEIQLEDAIDPAQDETQNVTQNEQPKVWTYDPIILIETVGPDQPGDVVFNYSKDSDPFGEFEITITSQSVGDLKVWYHVEHNMIDVSDGSWNIRTTLEVELVDFDDDNDVSVVVNPDADFGAILVPRVWVDDGILSEWVAQTDLILGDILDLPLTGEGTTPFEAGPRPYVETDESTRLALDGDLMLSSGDRVILRGRFEFVGGGTPVEHSTWGAIKALYGQ